MGIPIVKSVIDIMPRLNMEGDLMMVTDSRPAATNTKVIALINLLEMEPGTLAEYPDAGGRSILLSLYRAETPEATLSQLNAMAKLYIDLDVSFTYEKDHFNPEVIIIYGTITGLPGRIQFNVKREGNIAKIISPKYTQ